MYHGTVSDGWELWVGSICLSLTLLLGTLCIFLMVKVTYEPGRTWNKLTMAPYQWMFASQVIGAIFLTILIAFDTSAHVEVVLYSLKVAVENVAISVQIFEWFCLYHMIQFQSHHDMDTVEVEKRTFNPRERCVRNIFVTFMTLVVFGDLSKNIVLLVLTETG